MTDSVEWLERFAVKQECDDPMTDADDAGPLRAAAAEITRLRLDGGRLVADLYGMQDGAVLRDLQSENDRLRARVEELENQAVEARARLLNAFRLSFPETPSAAAQPDPADQDG